MKTIFSIFLLALLTAQFTFAQQQKIEDQYFEYAQIRNNISQKPEAIKQALALLGRSSELSKSQLGNVNYHVGRLYEETGDTLRAKPYYEKSLELIPNYYVPHLALGYADFKTCTQMIKNMNAAADAKNTVLHTKLAAEYKILATKTLTHLEKAQACDPDDETLKMIQYLYKTSKNQAGLISLDARLKSLSTHCITLLED